MKKILASLICVTAALCGYSQDKLSQLRTNKQIITMDAPEAPYYAVQVLALKLPPSDANFFKNLETVYEYPCSDGYVRYCVGRYTKFSEANAALKQVKDSGYEEAFVSYTKKFQMQSSSYSNKVIEILPDKNYVVQLSAFRYPVYLSFFEKVETVLEYRMNDKIFRYTTQPYKGTEIEQVLVKMKSLGYSQAFIVEYDRYAPFKIE